MSYIVFARKYRPRVFDEIVGQEHITRTLKNAIREDRVAHAYLFSGSRGIGKTTTARILAKALNCEKGPTSTPCNRCISCAEISGGTSLDVIEIDGASNRGIDEVRQLRENVKFMPTRGRYKLYIIDEVHMLTQEAFNALLKTLEEPPPHVKFVFATTHPNKVPATVLSRCQRFDFRKIPTASIVAKLKEIIKAESIRADEETLFSIARQSDGSLRDAESILDQVNTFSSGMIKKDDIARILGTVSADALENFVRAISESDTAGALNSVERLVNEGKDISFFILSLIEYFRNLMIVRLCSNPKGLIDLAPQSVDKLAEEAKPFSEEELFYIANILAHTYESARRSASPRIILELAMVKITKRQSLKPLNEILEKIAQMEKRLETPHPIPLPAQRGEGMSTNIIPAPHLSSPRAPRGERGYQHSLSPEGGEGCEASPQGDKGEGVEEKKQQPITDNTRSIELSRVQEVWPTVLKIIKTKKISVASYLLEGNIIALEDGVLTIGFPKNYTLHKEALEKRENRLIIEETLENILEKKIRVSFIIQDIRKDEPLPAYNGSPRGEAAANNNNSPKEDILREPMVQSALEIFEGRIVRKK